MKMLKTKTVARRTSCEKRPELYHASVPKERESPDRNHGLHRFTSYSNELDPVPGVQIQSSGVYVPPRMCRWERRHQISHNLRFLNMTEREVHPRTRRSTCSAIDLPRGLFVNLFFMLSMLRSASIHKWLSFSLLLSTYSDMVSPRTDCMLSLTN